MKINELLGEFRIAMSNEEAEVLSRISEQSLTPIHSFNERDRFIIENLIRKSLVSKVNRNNTIFVVQNDQQTDYC